MSWEKDLREAIRSIVASMIKTPTLRCVVKEVDKSKNTITATSEESGLDYFNVLLGANVGELGVLPYPTLGSQVILEKIGKSDTAAFVAQYTEIEEYLITLKNGFKLHLKADGRALINGGQYGGLGLTEKIAERIKRCEDAVESLREDINSHTHVVAVTISGATVTGSAAATNIPSTVKLSPKTTQDYISNSKVKHG